MNTPSTPGRRAAVLLTSVLLCTATGGCALWPFGRTEEPAAPHPRLAVVDDQGPFDPSEAVDDEDELGSAALDANREPSDAEPFADVTAQDARAGRDSAAADDETDEVSAPDEQPKSLPDGEHIATRTEVEELIESRKHRLRALRESRRSDAEAEAIATENPPAEAVGEHRSAPLQVLDFALESVLIVGASLVLTGVWQLAAKSPRTTILGVALLATLVTVVFATQGG